MLRTVQSAEAFDQLQATGMLELDMARGWEEFADAYDWMYRQMEARLPTSGTGALWLWADIDRRGLVAQCRQSAGSVLLTCCLPRERVLLSHFMDWHHALMPGLNVARLPGESDEEIYARWEPLWEDFNARVGRAGATGKPVRDWPADLREEVERSWECMFELNNRKPGDCWQATVHTLFAEDVVEAVRITGSGRLGRALRYLRPGTRRWG